MTVLIILWITFEFSVTVSLFSVKLHMLGPDVYSHSICLMLLHSYRTGDLSYWKTALLTIQCLSWEALKNWDMLSIFSHIASEKGFLWFPHGRTVEFFYIMVNILQSEYCKRQGAEDASLSNSELAQCHFHHNMLRRNFPVSMEGTYNHYPWEKCQIIFSHV